MIRKRPITFYIFAFTVIAFCGLVVFAFTVQQNSIQRLTTATADEKQMVRDKDAQLADLLDNYAALADDCTEAADCTTTTPSVTSIENTLPTVQGAPGRDGRDASDTQVADQVRSYCSARDDCRGIQGLKGDKGDSITGPAGAPSTIPGPPGNDSQIAGPPGGNGSNGLNGIDGRGITDISCQILENLTTVLRFTFTDTTTQDIPAPCTPQTPNPQE